MPRSLRLGVILLLSLVGLGGLLRLPLLPPLLARAASDTTLSDLESQESLLEVRQQANSLMSRFVGGEITRHYWGGFTPYLDVLGLEIPDSLEGDLRVTPERAQLLLAPRRLTERYAAEVVIVENMAKGVACRGEGRAPAFSFKGRQLVCPPGWQAVVDPLVLGNRQKLGADAK